MKESGEAGKEWVDEVANLWSHNLSSCAYIGRSKSFRQ